MIRDQTHGLRVIGVDPGPTPGVAYLECHEGQVIGCYIFQVAGPDLSLEWLVWQLTHNEAENQTFRTILAVEKFVIGARSSRVSNPHAAARTRQQIGALSGLYGATSGVQLVLRSASEVKPWATENRLVKAGFQVPKGMPHGTDAARHCLFAAVHDGGVPDPLSKGWIS